MISASVYFGDHNLSRFVSMLKLLPSPFSFSVTHYSHIEQTSTTEKTPFLTGGTVGGLCLWTSCLPSRRDVLGVSPQSSDHQIISATHFFWKKKTTRLATESETIVGMAQDFVGSNNINLWGNPPGGILDASGMFCRDEDRELTRTDENWRPFRVELARAGTSHGRNILKNQGFS